MNSFEKIHVIINPAAGNDEPILNTLNTVFHEHEARWDVSITHKFEDGKRLAQEAIANGADLIVAYGGDGTIVDVANGVVGSAVPLAVMPGGTGNGIHKELNMPLNLKDAASTIFTGEIASIDVAEANGAYFLLRADIGLIADIVSDTSRDMKDRWGPLAYLLNTANHLTHPKNTYKLRLDNQVIETEGIGCIVTNANKIGALNLGFHEDVKNDDGLLDIFVMTDMSTTIQNVASGLIQLGENVAINLHHWQAKTVEVSTQEAQTVLADGEEIGKTPISIAVQSSALKVIKGEAKG